MLDPHADRPVLRTGPPACEASAGLLLLHGRGDSAAGIIDSLGRGLGTEAAAIIAPQARGNSWFPRSFLASTRANEPALSSALSRLARLVEELEDAGLAASRLVIAGFSQGACLALEFVVRNPRRYGAVIAFTGGVLGPPQIPRIDARGALAGTNVFLGSGDPDPHVPRWRVEETANLLEAAGAQVQLRFYPGLGHTVSADEMRAARRLCARVLRPKIGIEASA